MSEKIFNFLPSKNKGGMEKIFLYYSEIMQLGGYEVVAIVPKKFQYFRELEELNIAYEILNFSGHYNVIAALKFWLLNRKHKAKFIFAHNGKAFSVINMLRKFLPNYVKDIAVCHGGSLKRVMPFTNAIVVSQYIADDLHNRGFVGSVFHVPNFLKLSDPIKASPASDVFRFGAISRLVKSKNFDFMLRAFADLAVDNAELLIAGEGDERQNLEQLAFELAIGDKVKFLGWIANNEAFFQKIDCLIHPAFAEPFGMIILEAMAAMTPVIAAANCGPLEIINDEKDGFLFQPGEIDDLKQKMHLVLEKTRLKESVTNLGCELVRSKYSFLLGKEKLLQVMKEINAR